MNSLFTDLSISEEEILAGGGYEGKKEDGKKKEKNEYKYKWDFKKSEKKN